MSRSLEQIAKELVRAAGQNKVEVWALLEEYEGAGGGPGVAAADGEGNTAALAAALRGHHSLVAALLERGASWAQVNAAGNTLLHQLAARPGARPPPFPFPPALVPARNRHGETALCKAARQGNAAWVAVLLAAGAPVLSLPPQPAVLPLLLPAAPPALVRSLVLAGPGDAAQLAWPYLAPEPLLLHALPAPAVLPLALAGADLGRPDAAGRTCLDAALAAGSLAHIHAYAGAPHTPATRALAAPHLMRLLETPDYQPTALSLLTPVPGLAVAAARTNATEILAALPAAEVLAPVVMAAAAAAGAVDAAVAVLGRGGALAAGRDPCGWTLLHRAAALGRPDAATALLAAGADPAAAHPAPSDFEEGGTPLHLAAAGGGPGHLAVVRLLAASPALNSQAHRRAWTPLHVAAAAGHLAALEALLAAGANTELADTEGNTARDLADNWPS